MSKDWLDLELCLYLILHKLFKRINTLLFTKYIPCGKMRKCSLPLFNTFFDLIKYSVELLNNRYGKHTIRKCEFVVILVTHTSEFFGHFYEFLFFFLIRFLYQIFPCCNLTRLFFFYCQFESDFIVNSVLLSLLSLNYQK